MKTLFSFLLLFIFSISLYAQEQKVEIVSDSLLVNQNLISQSLIGELKCGVIGIPIQTVSADYFLPFKLYEFTAKQENWFDHLSMYNIISAKVPGVSITPSSNLNSVPRISMRGDHNTIVIVDGIRYDVSILNAINPADIESVLVAPNANAANYLQNN